MIKLEETSEETYNYFGTGNENKHMPAKSASVLVASIPILEILLCYLEKALQNVN